MWIFTEERNTGVLLHCVEKISFLVTLGQFVTIPNTSSLIFQEGVLKLPVVLVT